MTTEMTTDPSQPVTSSNFHLKLTSNEKYLKDFVMGYYLYLTCLIWYFLLKNFLRPHSSIGRATDL